MAVLESRIRIKSKLADKVSKSCYFVFVTFLIFYSLFYRLKMPLVAPNMHKDAMVALTI